jgi:DNA-binding NarL/FixJ family response regulator
MKIILADDHAMFREGLRVALETVPRYEVIGEYENTEDLRKGLQHQRADLLIMDYRMPGGGSLATLKYLKQRYDSLKIIMLTGINVSAVFQQFIESKADGILIKDMTGLQMMNAVEKVEGGEQVIAPAVTEYLRSERPQLSSREYQIMELVLEGLGNIEMADRLNISVKTVGNHRFNLLQKLNLKNSVELTRYAIQNGFIDPD